MNLLVAGDRRVDAGKTTFATGLVAHTGAIGFKPRAGNDYWYSHDDCRTVLADGRLFGKDAKRLVGASPGSLDPEAINPVHRLWRPAPGGATGILGQEDRAFIVDRVGEEFVVNGTAAVPDSVRDALPLADATVVGSLEQLNAAMANRYVSLLSDLSREIADAERAVVESYGDVARPIREPVPDAVAVVEPGRSRLYDGDRFVKACEVAPGGRQEGVLEQRASSVVDLLDPAATHDLAPLSTTTRTDPAAVADAYAEVYDDLVALA